jgi:hypothetical protein
MPISKPFPRFSLSPENNEFHARYQAIVGITLIISFLKPYFAF